VQETKARVRARKPHRAVRERVDAARIHVRAVWRVVEAAGEWVLGRERDVVGNERDDVLARHAAVEEDGLGVAHVRLVAQVAEPRAARDEDGPVV
jgi:hypothetical protein